MEELWKKEFSLKEFTEKKQFKPYDQLKSRLDKVLGFECVASSIKAEDVELRSFTEDEVKVLDKVIADEDLDYFKSLANH